MGHRNLVICSVGDDSVHHTWLSDEPRREFDLCLIYFGNQPGKFAGQADYYFEKKGLKYALIQSLAEGPLGTILPQYDMIWLPDDDIGATTGQVNELFRLAKHFRLQVSQPSIGAGEVSFDALRQHPGYELRFTRFVEIMCPLFSREALARVLPLFGENDSAWGFDWVWSNMFGHDEVAVIDAVAVHHTRPLGNGVVYRRFEQLGVDPGTDLKNMRTKYRVCSRRWRRGIYHDTLRLRAIAENKPVMTRSLWTSFWPRKGKSIA